MRLLKLRCTKKLACICCMGACSENKRENYYQDTNMVLNMPYSGLSCLHYKPWPSLGQAKANVVRLNHYTILVETGSLWPRIL